MNLQKFPSMTRLFGVKPRLREKKKKSEVEKCLVALGVCSVQRKPQHTQGISKDRLIKTAAIREKTMGSSKQVWERRLASKQAILLKCIFQNETRASSLALHT